MKRKLLFAASFILIAWAVTSCEKTCKVCKQATYVDGVLDHTGSDIEYCGAELIAIESMGDVVIGTSRTTWECR